MKKCGIYKFTSPSGKIYIGSSINIDKRILYYKYLNCQGQIKLYNSFIKHGYKNHLFEIIELCNKEELYERERHYGELYDVLSDKGLNLILPKNGEIKKGVSDITREKMRQAHLGTTGTPLTDQHKELLRKAQTGRKHTLEHRMKVSLNSAKTLSKPVFNSETGMFYDSIKDAAMAHNIVHSTLKQRLGGTLANNTSFITLSKSSSSAQPM